MLDGPAHCRWTNYRGNGLGQDYALLTPHRCYLDLGATGEERQAAYRALFRYELDQEAINDTRLALSQNQPLDNECFNAKIERMTGHRRIARPRGRPRRGVETDNSLPTRQEELGLRSL